jgi:hypothetical protein
VAETAGRGCERTTGATAASATEATSLSWPLNLEAHHTCSLSLGSTSERSLSRTASGSIGRVRVKIMRSQNYRNVGESQGVLSMINPIISTRTRMPHWEAARAGTQRGGGEGGSVRTPSALAELPCRVLTMPGP